MRVLLDTHVFLWWAEEPIRVPAAMRTVIADPAHEVFLSVASVWEIQIKLRTGKLSTTAPIERLVSGRGSIRELPVLMPHVLALGQLPMHHRDPFDQLIIAQALAENLVIATVDEVFHKYPITLLG